VTDVKSNKPAAPPKAPPPPKPAKAEVPAAKAQPADPQIARDVAGAGRAIEGAAMVADQFIKDRLADGEALAGNHDLARFASGVVHALTSLCWTLHVGGGHWAVRDTARPGRCGP
jgi:hypothetical protein